MINTLSNKCAKNCCKRTILVQVIAEDVVTCFFLEHSVDERAAVPPRPLLAVPNVTANPSTASVPTTLFDVTLCLKSKRLTLVSASGYLMASAVLVVPSMYMTSKPLSSRALSLYVSSVNAMVTPSLNVSRPTRKPLLPLPRFCSASSRLSA